MSAIMNIIVITCLFVLLLIAFSRKFLSVVTIIGSSMEPVLASGDKVLVLRYFPKNKLCHDHIIVSYLPITLDLLEATSYSNWGQFVNTQPPLVIKRIVGLPHETITTKLDDIGSEWRENVIIKYDADGRRSWNIPDDHYFLKGDSPGLDSCIWGPVSSHNFIGLVILYVKRSSIPKVTI